MLQCNEEVTVNQKAYKLIKLLGHGKGGYSYLAKSNNELVVLKQIHPEPHKTLFKVDRIYIIVSNKSDLFKFLGPPVVRAPFT